MGDPNSILNSAIGAASPFSQILYNSTGSAPVAVTERVLTYPVRNYSVAILGAPFSYSHSLSSSATPREDTIPQGRSTWTQLR